MPFSAIRTVNWPSIGEKRQVALTLGLLRPGGHQRRVGYGGMTDCGPWVEGRVADLSRAGAEALEILGRGVTLPEVVRLR